MMRVLAAMSGGVDSAVAAARCVDAGHDVTGVHLALSANPLSFRSGARGCCTLEDARDARRAADVLGIPFYVWDLSERFRADVVADFVAEYAAGRTPNPCLRCNEKIKFAAVLDRAVALGFDAVCTGHYAKLVDGTNGRELHRAADAVKDQSYVLGVLTAAQLAHAMFPLGATVKSDVRAEASRRGLAVAHKPDSHDICFVADGDTAGFLRHELGDAPGQIVDQDGSVVGEHDGAYAYTVGQRRGLRIGRPAPDGKPRYVLDVSPVERRVTVGPAEALAVDEVVGVKPRWCGAPPSGPLECLVQYRAHGSAIPASAELAGEVVTVYFASPQHGVAPGQAVVLYDGTRVIGSATIDRTVSIGMTTFTTPAGTSRGL
jgi:tRNA-uridine 2-sulfurtransferase